MAKKRLRMQTSSDVRAALNRVANMVLNGEIDVKSANCIIYAASTILGSIRTDELETKVKELEATLEATSSIIEKMKS